MKLTKEEVINIASNARLKFNGEEIEKFQTYLNTILKYIEILDEVDTSNVEPLVYLNPYENNFREDKAIKSLSVEEVLLNVKDSDEGAVIVPKVVTE